MDAGDEAGADQGVGNSAELCRELVLVQGSPPNGNRCRLIVSGDPVHTLV